MRNRFWWRPHESALWLSKVTTSSSTMACMMSAGSWGNRICPDIGCRVMVTVMMIAEQLGKQTFLKVNDWSAGSATT
jgi:hypothetical protein